MLEFTITSFASSDAARQEQLHEAVGEANNDVNMDPAPALINEARDVVDRANLITNTINPIATAWGPLLDKVKWFSNLVDKVSEVWFKISWSSHAHGLLDSRFIRMRTWHVPSCLLRIRYIYDAYRMDTSDFWAHYIQTILAQKDLDDNINHLVEIMGKTYAVLQDVEALKKVKSHEGTIMSLMKQTIDCGYFIRDYAKNKGFCMVLTLSCGSSLC
jgi:hypothetical protein